MPKPFYNPKEEEIINENSLFLLADKLVSSIRELLRKAKSEGELKIEFEKVLEPIRKELSISPRHL